MVNNPLVNGWGDQQQANPLPEPLPEVPFVMRAGRFDPNDPTRAIEGESEYSKRCRIGVITNAWAKEDEEIARLSALQTQHPQAKSEADETPAERKARKNREAQERYRKKEGIGKYKNEANIEARPIVVNAEYEQLQQAKEKFNNIQRSFELHKQNVILELDQGFTLTRMEWDRYIMALEIAYQNSLST